LEQKTISESEGKRILSLIEKYGFKTAISAERKLLLRDIEGDKKRKGNSIHIILPTHIGEVEDREVRLSNIGDIFKTI
jgi:3-dehydroquinate synthetase